MGLRLSDGLFIKHFISGFGPDTMCLAWPAVVQIVIFLADSVSMISQENSFLFYHSGNLIFVFSL